MEPRDGLPTTDICDLDIEIPESAPLQIRHINEVTGPLISAQVQAIASGSAYIEALRSTCQQLQQQVAALKQRVRELEPETGEPKALSVIGKQQKTGT